MKRNLWVDTFVPAAGCGRWAVGLIAWACIAWLATAAAANVPQELHYQGYLTDAEGAPVHCPDAESCADVFDVTFRVYDTAEGGVGSSRHTRA